MNGGKTHDDERQNTTMDSRKKQSDGRQKNNNGQSQDTE